MGKPKVSDLESGKDIESVFSVKYKHPPKDYKNGYMFKIGLADKTGEVELTYFGGTDKEKVEEVYDRFKENDVVYVKGYAKEYKGSISINVNEDGGLLRKAERDEFDISRFLHRTNQDIDEMFDYVLEKAEEVENEKVRELLEHFFKDEEFVEEFKKAPAAMYMHHNCVGGLLEHVWGVLRVCETMKEIHPSLDEDLLVAGALLHDLGKVREFETTTNIKISEKGMLLSHIYISAEMVSKAIDEVSGFPEKLKNKILHIILSHHGEREHGALKSPQFPEAATIHLSDHMDSQLTQYIRVKKDTKEETEDFRTYSNHLGEIYLR